MDPVTSCAPIFVFPFSQIAMLGCWITAAAGNAFIVIDIGREYSEQTLCGGVPIFTKALYRVAKIKFPVLIVFVVFEIGFQLAPSSVDDSHRETFPVSPDKVISILPLGQTAVTPPVVLKIPPTGSLIVTTVAAEGSAAQVPLVTIALNEVVWVSRPEI